jgi:uncharacterized membrane protein
MRLFLPLLLITLSLPGTVAAQGASPGDDIEEIEEIEEIVPVESRPTDDFPGMVGKLHPAVVHVPIGWLLMLLVFDLMGVGLGRQEWNRFGVLILAGTLLSMIPGVVTGLLRASDLDLAGRGLELMQQHRLLIFVAAGLLLAAFAFRAFFKNRLAGISRFAYLGLVASSVIVTGWAGHLGASMVSGENYLPF